MLTTSLVLAASLVVGQTNDEKVPEDVMKELNRLAGTWVMTGEEGSDTYKAKYTNELASGRYAVRMRCVWSGAWQGEGLGFVAWDGIRKELFGPEAYEDGSVCRLVYKIESPGVWVGATQNSLIGKGKYEAKIRLEFSDATHYTWTATKATLNGQPQPDMKLKFTRVR
jgi:hypothetical protein